MRAKLSNLSMYLGFVLVVLLQLLASNSDAQQFDPASVNTEFGSASAAVIQGKGLEFFFDFSLVRSNVKGRYEFDTLEGRIFGPKVFISPYLRD